MKNSSMSISEQEQKSSSSYSSETSFDSGMSDNAGGASQSVFAAQSEEHLLMWETVPWTAKEWSSARERISLVQTRVLSTNDHQVHMYEHSHPPQTIRTC